ncbi:MAG TPA: HAD family phosphatase [Stackebrandtia sp.]|uniref:HAD family hydrolase n=1 Tax=Stackebrandtia sp. TaxID=2023065 RepID=UPI002D515AF5|nr:HAD family phosphatase [Stackebrandtia sp.]HZE42047.1 HAD family phosphatase [Stackebrandtia sp.]
MTPKLVIFDNDGVLVDSERLSNVVFMNLLTEVGLPTTFDQAVERYMGKRTTDCVEDIESRLGRALPDDFIATYERRCAEVFQRELTVVPGVPELLDALRATGIPYCIASSGSPDEIAVRLRLTGLAERFGDNVFSARLVKRGKPAPDLFAYAADAMGADPGDCVVIEDSVAGVTGAVAAGIRVIGHAGLQPPERLVAAGASEVVTGMDQVAPLLGV